ncbi:MAG: class I SAM-dependent methyltransferase [Gammaproteobacteria bacterium]|nr:class I SAM-dependent methyltransferase [Gammaproteobacteria bacterium]MDH5651853.1 class I SAM-dependent methyltransferase [Gammaproteobacteria bacterium]
MSNYQASRPCVLCDATDSKHYCSFNSLEYVQCNRCKLIYVDNFADNDAMYKAYTGGGLKSLRRKLLAPIRKMRSIKGYTHFLQRARGIFAFAKGKVPPAGGQRTYLDIGCNKGFLLAAAIEDDCNVHGVELVTELIAPFCNTYPDFKEQVYSDKFQDVAKRFSDKYFDIITAIDVVEHFEDPLSDMREVHRILKDNGVFVIQTPDIDCQKAKTLGCNWGALKPLEHLHLFGRENFVAFGKKAGFKEVTVSDPFEEADGNFVAVLKK